MKYLLLVLLLTSCTQSLKPGMCFTVGESYGITFYKVIEQKDNSFLLYSYSHETYTTLPPVKAFENREPISCEIVEKVLTKNKKVIE